MDKTINYVVRTKGDTKISPKSINIDGSDDPFYRYKMRQLYVQVVGRGKMIKTVLLNVDDVCKDLKIPSPYMTAYLGYEIGAKTKYDPKKPERERAIISGDLDPTDLSIHVKKFISDVILCVHCKLPEVTMVVDEDAGEVINTCRSCGGKSVLDALKAKFKQHILNHPVNAQTMMSKNEIKVRAKQDIAAMEAQKPTKPVKEAKEKSKKSKTKKDQEEEDDEEWSVSLSEEAIKERRKHLLPDNVQAIISKTDENGADTEEHQDPASQLQAFITENPKGDIAAKVKSIQEEFQFSNSKRAPLLFDVLFSESETVPTLTKYLPVFKKLMVDRSSKIGLLECFVKLFSTYKNDKAMIKALEQIYDNEVVDEETLLYWYDKKLSIPAAKTALAPFVTWLREAEEEEE
eukprot:TRINITY_DN7398_c0_g1_i1.p1 TRINITY_DN7398_c0_g1~~TRINITY_DN7398_c0_g1_i1.p1  ORF type:complete len:404 (+),score=95.12 TRINITY_DN7398_c0_g1_i1:78-1289(+)